MGPYIKRSQCDALFQTLYPVKCNSGFPMATSYITFHLYQEQMPKSNSEEIQRERETKP